MSKGTRVRILTNRLPEIVSQLKPTAREVNHDTATKISMDAMANAAEDSGSMKLGIYVSTAEESDYSEAVSAAEAVNDNVEIVDEVVPPDDDSAVVGVAVAHGMHIEYGTVNMAAQPFLVPAAEKHRKPHKAMMTERLREL